MEGRIKGKIKWFDPVKGIGYIAGADGQDYFIHASAICTGRTYLGYNKNDEVAFVPTTSAKGPKARAVTLEDNDNPGDAAE